MNKDKNILFDYLPHPAVEPIVEWLHQNHVQLKISKTRNTKLGDFKAPLKGETPRISVNHNLNRYAFLITLVHEMAHVVVWRNQTGFRRIKPHGKEWQQQFSLLMHPFLTSDVFPDALLPAVQNYFKKPKASSVSDQNLMHALKAYDAPSDYPQLSELEAGNYFTFRNVSYELIQKQRTRYQCRNLSNGRMYLIHGLAEVEKLNQ